MIRPTEIFLAVALFAFTSAGARAQKIDGTYEFPQQVMTAPGAAPIDVRSKLVVTVKGDSVNATWLVPIPGKEAKPTALHGTAKGNVVTLSSDVQQATMRGADGSNERTIDVTQQYVLTINGDEITADITAHATDDSVEMPGRTLKGKRVG